MVIYICMGLLSSRGGLSSSRSSFLHFRQASSCTNKANELHGSKCYWEGSLTNMEVYTQILDTLQALRCWLHVARFNRGRIVRMRGGETYLSHRYFADAWLKLTSLGAGIHLTRKLKWLVPLNTMTLDFAPTVITNTVYKLSPSFSTIYTRAH